MPLVETLGTALVTGASTGIGATYADRLAQRGHDLVLVARRKDALQALAQRITRQYGVKAEALAADLTVREQRLVVEQRLRDDDTIDLLVNNAGCAAPGTFASGCDPDQLESMIQLNVVTPSRLTGAMLPRLLARGHGSIIIVSSALAIAPEAVGGAYPATKSYLLTYAQGLHQEVGHRGIRVQVVLPGATRTAIWERSGRDMSVIPAHMIMEVDEMVDAALAGYDQGELVTVPSLPDVQAWNRYEEARLHLGPDLSRNIAADRYKSDIPEDA